MVTSEEDDDGGEEEEEWGDVAKTAAMLFQ